MKSLSDCRLYTFVDTAFLRGRAPELVAQQLCDGGSDLIQLRAKNIPPAEIRRMAAAILPVTRRAGVGLVINDHLEMALELGAECCHLGQEDFFDAGRAHVSQLTPPPHDPVAAGILPAVEGGILPPGCAPANSTSPGESSVVPAGRDARLHGRQDACHHTRTVQGFNARKLSGNCHSQLLIGLSTHAPAQAERALAAGPGYIAIGPVYATGTKPSAKPVTLDYVRWAARHVTIPWFAIGGINLENLDDVLAAGARRVCVVSAILNAPDVAEACRQFKKRIV